MTYGRNSSSSARFCDARSVACELAVRRVDVGATAAGGAMSQWLSAESCACSMMMVPMQVMRVKAAEGNDSV